jgi:hypothetical protein
VSINILPDVALLEIFDFYLGGKEQKLAGDERKVDKWLPLVHVCTKWRDLVFGSTRRLGIRLWYKANLPLEEMLSMWPPLPIDIWVDTGKCYYEDTNIIAALDSEHNDRISRINLWDILWSEMEDVLAAMHRPFPALTCLVLAVDVYEHMMESPLSAVPDSFLGGSAPHLQILILHHIPFPGLPKLLLSATRLVKLYLTRIPVSVYFPPEVLVDCLSVLTRLEILNVGFDEFGESFLGRFDQTSRYPPPPKRLLLSVLTELSFRGSNEYSEDLVARIDAPLLDTLRIAFFREPVIDTLQLSRFIGRAPKLKTRDEARVVFYQREVSVALPLPQTNNVPPLKLGISYKQTQLHLSPLARVCGSSFPKDFIPAVNHLDIIWNLWGSEDPEVIENSEWLELLRPFTAVKSLYISEEAVPRIAPALQELVGERVIEVLPALETLTLYKSASGPIQEGIARFVSARQLTGHPVAISYESGYNGLY